MPEPITLKVLSPFMIDGDIAQVGELVEVTISEAKDLLNRDKAELATEADVARVAPKKGLSVGSTKTEDEAEDGKAGKYGRRGK